METHRFNISIFQKHYIARIVPVNGSKFFNKFSYVNANLKNALNDEELKQLNTGYKS